MQTGLKNRLITSSLMPTEGYIALIIGIPIACYMLARVVTSAYFHSKVDFIRKFKAEGDKNGEENED